MVVEIWYSPRKRWNEREGLGSVRCADVLVAERYFVSRKSGFITSVRIRRLNIPHIYIILFNKVSYIFSVLLRYYGRYRSSLFKQRHVYGHVRS